MSNIHLTLHHNAAEVLREPMDHIDSLSMGVSYSENSRSMQPLLFSLIENDFYEILKIKSAIMLYGERPDICSRLISVHKHGCLHKIAGRTESANLYCDFDRNLYSTYCNQELMNQKEVRYASKRTVLSSDGMTIETKQNIRKWRMGEPMENIPANSFALSWYVAFASTHFSVFVLWFIMNILIECSDLVICDLCIPFSSAQTRSTVEYVHHSQRTLFDFYVSKLCVFCIFIAKIEFPSRLN